jgi:acylphosphatase
VSGYVQGVYFRDTCRKVATDHGVTGWVRNLPDGRVEAVFEGTAENVRRLVDWARHGPDRAVVAHVTVLTEQPEGLPTFMVR